MTPKIISKTLLSLGLVFLLGSAITHGRSPATSAFAQQRASRQSVAKPANIIVITNTNDSGSGSLRQALLDANDGDIINFDSSLKGQTITLTSGQLIVDKSVTISGPGANRLAVDGNGTDRVFSITPAKTVTISGLTITNGNVTSGRGGGISNAHGTLTLSHCTVSGNSADYGGGIANGDFQGNATLTITNSTVSSNSGGGISNFGNHGLGVVTIVNSTISGNYNGSGISSGAFDGDAALTISNSTVSGNSATADGSGGGVSSGAAGSKPTFSVVTINSSVISGNSAGNGGGIFNNADGGFIGAMLSITNSTLSGNSATGNGGGIYNNAGGLGTPALTIANSTLSGNSADVSGGGIYNSNQQGLAGLALGSTILNAGGSGENIFNNGGTVTSYGYNLSSDDAGGYLTGPGDQINTDPLLGPLQNNGGPTFTHALSLGSPAINAGDPNFTPPPLYDQRGPGLDRKVNGRIDIGSFEVQAGTPTPTPTVTPIPCASIWVERANMPYAGAGIFTVSDGTYVYAGGGATGDLINFHDDLVRYDPETDSWTTLEHSPDAHALSQAVYL